MLSSNRIILNPLSEADLNLIMLMNGDAETMKFIGGTETPFSKIQTFIQEQKIHFEQHNWGWMVIETRQTQKIGLVFLRRCSRLSEIEIGYRLCRNYWCQGYATESAKLLLSHALTELHLNPIVAAVDPLNTASERVLQKIGMQYWKDIDWETTPSGFARCYKAP